MVMKLEYTGDDKLLKKSFKNPLELYSRHKIGRGKENNDIVLTEYDNRISRKHAMIDAEDGYIGDIGSHNGTYVDGESIGHLKASDLEEFSKKLEVICRDYKTYSGGVIDEYYLRKSLNGGEKDLEDGDVVVFGAPEYKFRVSIGDENG